MGIWLLLLNLTLMMPQSRKEVEVAEKVTQTKREPLEAEVVGVWPAYRFVSMYLGGESGQEQRERFQDAVDENKLEKSL